MRASWAFLATIFLFTTALFAQGGAAPKPKSARPDVILITLDTTRADRMGFLGSGRALTPHLDALAAQSIVFTRAYAHVPLTTPSHATILTGTYPQFSHIIDLGDPLAKEVPYLPEILHRHGYATAAFVASVVLDPKAAAPGFDRGFDTYDAGFHQKAPAESRYASVERRADVVIDHALAWLVKHPRRPLFLWVHLYDPHHPYDPPEPYKTKYAANLYDGEIASTDTALGRLLDQLHKRALYENSVIAVMADHGEAFGEHGEREHGIFLYDETIHVPLLIKLPRQRDPGTRVEEQAGLADVAPTILQAIGIPAPPSMQGASLLAAVGRAPRDHSIYSESQYAHMAYGWAILRSWRSGNYLFVQAPQRELYDQTADPGALHNLATASAAVADTLASQLDDFHRKTSTAVTTTAGVNPQAADNLRALGYVSSNAAVAEDKSKPALDPKDHIEAANLMTEALIDIEEQRFPEAIAKLRKAADQAPRAGMVYLELGNALLQGNQTADAIPVLRKATELMPDAGPAHARLGLALMEKKDWAGAIAEFQAALAHSENSADLHLNLGIALTHSSRILDAAPELETAAKMDPGSFRANLEAGRVLGMQGNVNGALPYLQQAVLLDPNSHDAHHFLANIYRQLGREDDADREQEEADRLQPAEKK
jgi:arylsulfatase A-like enzyme/Tfp pilus assembly protein PilF